MDSASTFIALSAIIAITAFLAIVLHGFNFREALVNQHVIREAMVDGLGEEVAATNVRIEASRLAQVITVFVSGILLLLNVNINIRLGLFALIPVISIWSSWRDMKSRAKSTELAAALLVKRHKTELAECMKAKSDYPNAPDA